MPLNELIEDALPSLKHKHPSVRAETCSWLLRGVKNTRTEIPKAVLKTLVDALVTCCDDTDACVRERATETLGTLMKLAGDRPLAFALEKLDNLKSSKVREYAEAAKVKGFIKTIPKEGKPSRVDKENTPAHPSISTLPRKQVAPQRLRAAAPPKKAVEMISSSTAKQPVSVPKLALKDFPPEPVYFRYNKEAAMEAVKMEMTAELFERLANSDWKVRAEAMNELATLLPRKTALSSEAIVTALTVVPGWKEKNFQVMSLCINIMSTCADTLPTFTKEAAARAVEGIVSPEFSSVLTIASH